MHLIRHTLLCTILALATTPLLAETPGKLRTPVIANWGQIPADTLDKQAAAFPDTFYLEGPGSRKLIALTYDDGPGEATPALLDLLKKHGVKATFFWQGANVEAHPDLVKRALAEGHTLANHSYSHPNLSEMADDSWWTSQIARTQQAFQQVAGFQPALMRPPYGFLTDDQIKSLKSRGMRAILWSVDTADWYHTHTAFAQEIARDRIADVVRTYVHPEAIVLMHDSGGYTRKPSVDATALLIPELKKKGYAFTTVDRLLNVSAKVDAEHALAPDHSAALVRLVPLISEAANTSSDEARSKLWPQIMSPDVVVRSVSGQTQGLNAFAQAYGAFRKTTPADLKVEISTARQVGQEGLYAWQAKVGDQVVAHGVDRIELDGNGLISRLTTYDGLALQ
ncbi:polysaccharide deacetylase family protein [Chitinibacteraceae bacterium HSL-7]